MKRNAIALSAGAVFVAIAFTFLAHAGPTGTNTGCYAHNQATQYTWRQYAGVLDAAIANGTINPDTPMTVCTVDTTGNGTNYAVYGIGGNNGVVPVGILGVP